MPRNAKLVMFLVIFFAIIAGLIYLYQLRQNSEIPHISDDYKVIGVVDMDFDRGISPQHIRSGDDVLIVIRKDTNAYRKVMALARQSGNNEPEIRFELQLYDENHDRLIDNEDTIWPDLRAIVFYDGGTNYQAKTLGQVGIRGINLKHLTAEGNHQVILSDGTERTLYELGAPLKSANYTPT